MSMQTHPEYDREKGQIKLVPSIDEKHTRYSRDKALQQFLIALAEEEAVPESMIVVRVQLIRIVCFTPTTFFRVRRVVQMFPKT